MTRKMPRARRDESNYKNLPHLHKISRTRSSDQEGVVKTEKAQKPKRNFPIIDSFESESATFPNFSTSFSKLLYSP